jgi:hypothetical protein
MSRKPSTMPYVALRDLTVSAFPASPTMKRRAWTPASWS